MLRPYQQRAVADLRAAYSRGHRAPCLVLPTGGGKTLIASEIISLSVARGRRVLFLAHRQELIAQSVAKLESAGVTDLRIIQASSDLGSRTAPVSVASIPTLTRWSSHLPDADLVIFDEAHHVVAKTWGSIASRYPSAHLLGLTATPQRGDGKPLGDIFDALVIGSTVRELTDAGHLVPCRVFAPPQTLDTAELAVDVVQAYREHGDGQRAIVFCVSLEHARTVADDLTTAGFQAEVVHGGLGSAPRRATLARFRSGETRIVVNVHVLTEGFDDPEVAVCILARKPQHAGTFLQMVGRVLRPAAGKHRATLVDLCGSVHKHGTPDCDREYTLDGKGISGVERQAICQCLSCGAVFLTAQTCPECGATLAGKPAELPRATGVGLTEVTALPPLRTFTVQLDAKHPGRCVTCKGRIGIGERIYWAKGVGAKHQDCGRQSAIDEAERIMRSIA